MQFSLYRLTPPLNFPVTLDEVKSQVGVPLSSTEHDNHLMLLLGAAASQFELKTRRALLPQTWVYERIDPIRAIELPRPPLYRVERVQYRDRLEDVWVDSLPEEYIVEESRQPARITWVDSTPRQIRVTYIAGHIEELVPEDYKLTILQLVTHYFENRGDVAATLPVALQGLIDSQRCGTTSGYWYE